MESEGLAGTAGTEEARPSFRLGFVPGVTPAKWARTWQQRHPDVPLHLLQVEASAAEQAVIAGDLDAALLRPPVDRTLLHAITLYEEEVVVLVPGAHMVAALDESEAVDPADLAQEVLLQPADDVVPWAGSAGAQDEAIHVPGQAPVAQPATAAAAVALVAAGVGILVLPRSLARLHHRKDVTARALAGGPAAPVALAWPIDRADDRTEDLIGIVRGRSVNSSRGRQPAEAPSSGAERRTPSGKPTKGASQGAGGSTSRPRRPAGPRGKAARRGGRRRG